MLEVKRPGARTGTEYAGESLVKGSWVRVSGTFSSGDITTIQTAAPAQVNAAGFANVGSNKIMQAVPGEVLPCYPVNKLILKPEDAEADLQTIAAGEGVIYYIGGEYESDQYSAVSGTGAAPGNFLKVGSDGILVEEASPSTETTASVATVHSMFHGIDRDGVVQDILWFRMLAKES